MTTRFCPRCGTLLEATAWYGGVCSSCGAKVDVTRGVLGPEGVDSAEVATQLSAAGADTDAHAYAFDAGVMPADGAATTPVQPAAASTPVNASIPTDASRSRRAPSPWVVALIGMLVVALVAVSLAYVLAPRGTISIILAPFSASGASASSNSPFGGGAPTAGGTSGGSGAPASPTNTANPGAIGAPTTSATPVGIGTVSPGSTVVPTVSATAAPSPVGSPVPGPAVLSVAPTSITIPLTVCVLPGAQTNITVANPGGQPLTWSATVEPVTYTLSASSGRINAGQSTNITVSAIIGTGGTVTFSAPGAANSQQKVTIICTAPPL